MNDQPFNVGTARTIVDGERLPHLGESPLDAVIDRCVGTTVSGIARSPKGRRGLLLSDSQGDYVLWFGERGDKQWLNLRNVEA